MPAIGFPVSRLVTLAICFVLAILGLFAVAGSMDLGMTLFGSGLTLVSLGFGFVILKSGADSLWGH